MPITIDGTTGISGNDGSAGTPALRGDDANTGMFFPAADTIAFSEGGVERLRIADAGQIGIGGANYGTSGQVLTSGGPSAAPSWAAAPTPASLSTASGSAPSFSARAWVNFNGTGTVAIRASGNVSSITDNGTGQYTVNFATAMPDANYAVSGSAQISSFAGTGWQGYSVSISSTAPTASAARILTSSYAAGAFDASIVNVAIFR
jgi:hypothetical protein